MAAQFCGQERVGVSTFYYWAKRVGSVAPREQRHDLGDVIRPTIAGCCPTSESRPIPKRFRDNRVAERRDKAERKRLAAAKRRLTRPKR